MVCGYSFPSFLFEITKKYVLPLFCLSSGLREDLNILKNKFKKGGDIDRKVKVLLCVYTVFTRRGCESSLQNKQGMLFFGSKAKS